MRRLIYTTNAIEALNSKIRRAVRTRGHFPSDEAAAKLIYLTLDATPSSGSARCANGMPSEVNSSSCSKIASQWRKKKWHHTKFRIVPLAVSCHADLGAKYST
ncbi:Transposase for insertion sequence element ISRM3 [Gluconacetobacter sp. SXCC-1]|nr:Transposase for insertion sequence element ISRM3 [Gluconacetobacter sp. SXCC-1]